MSVEDAKKAGAVGVFDNRYGDLVKVYTIGISKEICGGPHANARAKWDTSASSKSSLHLQASDVSKRCSNTKNRKIGEANMKCDTHVHTKIHMTANCRFKAL